MNYRQDIIGQKLNRPWQPRRPPCKIWNGVHEQIGGPVRTNTIALFMMAGMLAADAIKYSGALERGRK